MNFIMKGIHAALEPLRYAAPVAVHHPGGAERAAGTTGLIDRIKYRRKVRRTVLELSALSDAMLKDIGIERGNIPALVEETLRAPAKKPLEARNTGDEHMPADYPIAGGAAA